MEAIKRFHEDHFFLSNFYPAEVELDGLRYRTVEHAYQAAKSLSPSARAHIQSLRRPGDAKRAGSWRSQDKRIANTAMRREGKKLLEDAPKKRADRGYSQ